MSISPPPLSPPRCGSDSEDDADGNFSVSSFDIYKDAIDAIRNARLTDQEEINQTLERFKSLTTRTNAWLYLRQYDDLIDLLISYLNNDSTKSKALSIFANIACDQASHMQILDTEVIDIVCRNIINVKEIDITNRCFRLLGNICTIADAAKKMIDADVAFVMGNILRSCENPACLHSTIRCSRKLSQYTFGREKMLDTMCLLSICKQLFAKKIDLRKEAMKAVVEWKITCDRSRSQIREGQIFKFLMSTIESKTDKEFRHVSFRLLQNLLHYPCMRTEFGLCGGFDFLLRLIDTRQSVYEHLQLIGLSCVCCQEVNNRLLLKQDQTKLNMFFVWLNNPNYRTHLLDMLLTALAQFMFDESTLIIFTKQMNLVENLCELLEQILVKYGNQDDEKTFYEKYIKNYCSDDDDDDEKILKRSNIDLDSENKIKRFKLDNNEIIRKNNSSIIIDSPFHESLFMEFVENNNTNLDDEQQIQSIEPSVSAFKIVSNVEKRRRTEALIFILLSKLSYENTDCLIRTYLYNKRLMCALLRYVQSVNDSNPRSVRILNRLTKILDLFHHLVKLGLPYYLSTYFHKNPFSSIRTNIDQYLIQILLNDNRSFFQQLSWINDDQRLITIEFVLLKNIEHNLNTPFVINEVIRLLNTSSTNETDKFHTLLTVVATIKEPYLKRIMLDECNGLDYLLYNLTIKENTIACAWGFHKLLSRCPKPSTDYVKDFIIQLKAHSHPSSVISTDEPRDIQLCIIDESPSSNLIFVNSKLLSLHSKYFQTLFNCEFSEHNQQIINIHLPLSISFQSFKYLIDLIHNDIVETDYSQIKDLYSLCDHFLFDYLPYRLSYLILEQILNNPTSSGIYSLFDDDDDRWSILSKPNLISCLLCAYVQHLFTITDDDTNLACYIRFFRKYSTLKLRNTLRIITKCFIYRTCWFENDSSPF